MWKVGDTITGALHCAYCDKDRAMLIYIGKINPKSVWACTSCAPVLRDMPAKEA